MHSHQPEPHPAPAAAADFETRDILGVPIALTDYDAGDGRMDAHDRPRASAATSAPPPVHAVMVAQDDPEMRAALLGADADRARRQAARVGAQPARRAPRRPRLRPRADARATARALRRARPPRLALRRARPGRARRSSRCAAPPPPRASQIVGGYSPPFRPLTARGGGRDVAAQINARRPDVVWVGIGVPKQEKWMARMRDRARRAGAGRRRRRVRLPRRAACSQAPAWMQRARARVALPHRAGAAPAAGGATCATTRASSPRSRASTCASGAPP